MTALLMEGTNHGYQDPGGIASGYFRNNEQEMCHDVFGTKGYETRSSPVEGACKRIVGKRLTQSGIIWTRTDSSAILASRMAWLNEKWEQLWQSKPLAAREFHLQS